VKTSFTTTYARQETSQQHILPQEVEKLQYPIYPLQFTMMILISELYPHEFKQSIVSGEVMEYPGVEGYAGAEGDLLRGMLEVDPELRMTAEDVLDHEWFKSQ
jgi:serine/threonine protein kinase